MGRGNNSSLLYGADLGALRAFHKQARTADQNVPNYCPPLERVNNFRTEYYSDGSVEEKFYGNPDTKRPFVKHFFDKQGNLVEIHRQAPITGYDYINGYYYDPDDQKQPEYETQVPEVSYLLDKPKLDLDLFAHHPAEWDIPSYVRKDEQGRTLNEQHWRFDEKSFDNLIARDPRLGPAEINYYPSGRVKSERYWTIGYRDQRMKSTMNNPYGPSETLYYDSGEKGRKPVKSQKWMKLIKKDKAITSQGAILKGFTELGRCNGGPGYRKFNENGDLTREEYYGEDGALHRDGEPAKIEYDSNSGKIIIADIYSHGQFQYSDL